MSDAGDIIHAFQGIISSLQRSMKTDFWAGLPEAYFDYALLWIGTGPHSRRSVSKDGSTNISFPSWSWAGWHSPVLVNYFFSGFVHPEIDWFIIDQTGSAIQLDTLTIQAALKPSRHPQPEHNLTLMMVCAMVALILLCVAPISRRLGLVRE
jgi:hypothetical protein